MCAPAPARPRKKVWKTGVQSVQSVHCVSFFFSTQGHVFSAPLDFISCPFLMVAKIRTTTRALVPTCWQKC